MIRVFVGCAANGEDLESQAVLEYSLRKHTSRPVEVVWMQLSKDPISPFYSAGSRGWQTALWSTPFSGFRWAVPSLCGFEGKAVYCDSDVIFLDDIAELWDQQFQLGKVILAKGGRDSWRFCVCLWDCEAARIHLPKVRDMTLPAMHGKTINKFTNASFVQSFEGDWNCIDGEYQDLSQVKALHYSSEAHQPHLKYAVPRLEREGLSHWFDGEIKSHWRPDVVALFDQYLEEAIREGYGPERYRPERLFGPYNKKSHAGGYRSHRFAPS